MVAFLLSAIQQPHYASFSPFLEFLKYKTLARNGKFSFRDARNEERHCGGGIRHVYLLHTLHANVCNTKVFDS